MMGLPREWTVPIATATNILRRTNTLAVQYAHSADGRAAATHAEG